MLTKKKKVLFIGSFLATAKDGGVGGQMFASKTIVNSSLNKTISWTLLDTTARSNILSSNFVRIYKAFIRLVKFLYYILFFKFDYILIFVGDGWSFWEKGLMSIFGKYLSRAKIILAPRSGFLVNNINNTGKLRKFIKFVFNKVDIIICQSQYWKRLFEKLAYNQSKSKFVVIENMINFEDYKGIKIREASKNISATILFMAWVTRAKGIYELIEAIKMLAQEGLKFKVIIAGHGDEYETIRKSIDKSNLHNFVEMKGWVLGDEKHKILAESDIFVLPTYFEGYPNSLVEAMAAGKACIATKVGSIPDMIDHKKTGLLIEKESSKQLYESLSLLINNENLRKTISINARNKIQNTNTVESGISKFKEIFN